MELHPTSALTLFTVSSSNFKFPSGGTSDKGDLVLNWFLLLLLLWGKACHSRALFCWKLSVSMKQDCTAKEHRLIVEEIWMFTVERVTGCDTIKVGCPLKPCFRTQTHTSAPLEPHALSLSLKPEDKGQWPLPPSLRDERRRCGSHFFLQHTPIQSTRLQLKLPQKRRYVQIQIHAPQPVCSPWRMDSVEWKPSYIFNCVPHCSMRAVGEVTSQTKTSLPKLHQPDTVFGRVDCANNSETKLVAHSHIREPLFHLVHSSGTAEHESKFGFAFILS